MNQELLLKLQARLDGELSEREGRQVVEVTGVNTEAHGLLQELTMTRTLLRTSEVEMPRVVPATREFYWSQISRAIEQSEIAKSDSPAVPSLNLWGALRRYFVPMAGGAFVLFLTAAGLNYYDYSPMDLAPHRQVLSKVENQSEHTSSFSFRSHSENMTVVWVYDKSSEAKGADPVDDDKNDAAVQ